MAFMDKIIGNNTSRVYYICGQGENARNYWYFLFLTPNKIQSFEKLRANDEFDLADYGSIIKAGEGSEAPAEIMAEMRDNYNCDF